MFNPLFTSLSLFSSISFSELISVENRDFKKSNEFLRKKYFPDENELFKLDLNKYKKDDENGKCLDAVLSQIMDHLNGLASEDRKILELAANTLKKDNIDISRKLLKIVKKIK